MAFEIKIFGKEILSYRSLENPNTSLSDPDVVNSLLGDGYKSASGAKVTPQTALSISAFYRGVALLAGHMASLPLSVYHRGADGNRAVAYDHPTYRLLHDSPNHLFTSFTFRETMMVHLLVLDGNFYSIIERDAAYRPVRLWMLDPKQVTPILVDGQMFYFVNGFAEPFPARDIIHVAGLGFDGIKGLTPLRVAAESIGYSITLQQFSQNFFKNGANVGAVVEHPSKMTEDQYRMFRDSWERAYAGIHNTGKTAILQGGAKLNKVGIAPEEAQYLESRKHSVTDIARILGVPPHKIYDLERSTNNNIEHQGLEYVQDSLLTWITRTEQEFNRKLYTGAEIGKTYCKYNVNGLLRGDVKSRSEYYSKMVAAGIMTPDEARQYEEMNTMGGMASELHFPLNSKTENQLKSSTNE